SVRDWYGSLLLEQQDASGLLYRRNRYYDPQTGRFTQEDPIGIAGGLNLYGYANGDPVNFGDPFGLQPCDTKGDPRTPGDCGVIALGFSSTLVIGGGGGRALGVFWDKSQGALGLGVYSTGEFAIVEDTQVGMELVSASSRDHFEGASPFACLGVGFVGFCGSDSKGGNSITFEFGIDYTPFSMTGSGRTGGQFTRTSTTLKDIVDTFVTRLEDYILWKVTGGGIR
ncbi:MAG: RHS repeat-associated core domain-containing protein, partial [Bacteroidetes bacterium]